MDIDDLVAKYDRKVPRYTSYPTAPHFSAAVTPNDYGSWLADLPDSAALSIYLHIPFCASLCLFCACHTTVVRNPEPMQAYAEVLKREIDLVAAAIGRRLLVRHIHWGGGTPTALPPGSMVAVMDHLRANFALAAEAEIAVEIDPRTLTDASRHALAAIGTNRVSLGVQDFDPLVQAEIKRHQSYDLTASCVEKLRRQGIPSVNLDLIYGLPHQTENSVRQTVSQAMALSPDRAAVFGYAHVPWMKKHQSLLPEAALPGPGERFRQRGAIEQVVTDAGYRTVGMDHFAHPRDSMAAAAAEFRLRRNFQGYTTDDAPVLIGLGASSIGSLPAGYVQNHAAVPTWRDSVRAGMLPVARGIALDPDDRLRRAVIDRIMCDFAVDLRAEVGGDRVALADLMDAAPALEEMERDGLVNWDGAALRVTADGRPFVRTIAAAFDRRLQPGEARHTASV